VLGRAKVLGQPPRGDRHPLARRDVGQFIEHLLLKSFRA
jgi:hypothetical protein